MKVSVTMLSLRIDSAFSSLEISGSKEEQMSAPTPTTTEESEEAEEILSSTLPVPPVSTTSSAWGWFDEMEEAEEAMMGLNRPPCSITPEVSCEDNNCTLYHLTSQCVMEQGQKTFSPLRPNIDMPYLESSICWVQNLPAKRHLSTRIQVRSFRIRFLDAAKQQGVAEYLVDFQLNNNTQHHITRWKRSSSIDQFVRSKLNRVSFPKSLQVWKEITAICRWFNRLEVTYLEQKCVLIHQFTQKLLYESASIHTLADLLEN